MFTLHKIVHFDITLQSLRQEEKFRVISNEFAMVCESADLLREDKQHKSVYIVVH